MYWGLPCLTLDVLQGPEVWYIKQGETGFVLKDEEEFKNKILELFNDEDKVKEMSEKARELMRNDGDINKMFEGFYNAVNYATNK